MSNWVLDASAVLALVQREPGDSRVAQALIDGSLVSTVNLAEVITKLSDGNVPEPEIRAILSALAFEVVSFEEPSAYGTGLLRAATRHLGLSLGDRACLELALSRDVPALTTEENWLRLGNPFRVEKIR